MYLIEVDGGIDTENAAKLIEAGVNVWLQEFGFQFR